MTFYLSRMPLREVVVRCIDEIKAKGKNSASYQEDFLWFGQYYNMKITIKKKRF